MTKDVINHRTFGESCDQQAVSGVANKFLGNKKSLMYQTFVCNLFQKFKIFKVNIDTKCITSAISYIISVRLEQLKSRASQTLPSGHQGDGVEVPRPM